MSLIASRAAKSQKLNANNLEVAYSGFCESARPLTLYAIFLAGQILLLVVIAISQKNNQFEFVREINAVDRHYGFIVWFYFPAIIALVRGRAFLKRIILGQLTTRRMLATGFVTAIALQLCSVLVAAPFVTFRIDFSGLLVDPFNLSPVTEEVLFQVGVQTWLQRFGPAIAVIGTTLAFWGAHIYGGFIPSRITLLLLPSLLALAIIRQTTKSTGAALLAHSAFNVIGSMYTQSAK